MTSDNDHLLSEQYLDGLRDRSLDELRDMRAECVEVETGLSYLRRLVQGRLDIVRREQRHRAAGEAADSTTLVEELADVLSEGPRAEGVGRLSVTLEPTTVDPAFAAELAELERDALKDPESLDDAELASLSEGLSELERRISERRRAFFVPIDALQAEITRRYRDGEASVDALLAEP